MIKISPATEEQIEQILEIEKEAISPPWSHGALLSEIYSEDSYFIVAKNGLADSFNCPNPCSHPCLDPSEVLGFAILRQVGDDGELLQIATKRSARRRGVGDSLIKNVLQHAISKAYQSVFLEVRKSNDVAIHLYEKHSFTTLRVRKDYYTDPIEDANIMIKSLNE
ncbi:MAG: ribosomal protein S18-alanine N-acetyltransferase [Oscillospiraceae bacterium]|nr:ribosomal protein S18-alanine N-acetyltransferase [Oscillospiraceae bacterium]